MDNQKPQFHFEVKDEARILLDNGISITTNVYKQTAEGISFITRQRLDGAEAKDVYQEYYYFFPWPRIKLFMVPVKKVEPIKPSKEEPLG